MEQFNEKQEFEVHVTIESTDDITPFINICDNFVDYINNSQLDDLHCDIFRIFSCKAIIIELPAGVNKQQPMCSIFLSSTLNQAIKCGEVFGKYCNDQYKQYTPCRNKVEARFRNVKDNTINLDHNNNKSLYWEFHIKLIFETTDISIINNFRKNLEILFPCVRLSKSALSSVDKSQPGFTSRVVTLRLYNGDKNNAQNQLDNLLFYLNDQNIQSKYHFKTRNHVEKELSVYDTNVSHDIGWIHI